MAENKQNNQISDFEKNNSETGAAPENQRIVPLDERMEDLRREVLSAVDDFDKKEEARNKGKKMKSASIPESLTEASKENPERLQVKEREEIKEALLSETGESQPSKKMERDKEADKPDVIPAGKKEKKNSFLWRRKADKKTARKESENGKNPPPYESRLGRVKNKSYSGSDQLYGDSSDAQRGKIKRVKKGKNRSFTGFIKGFLLSLLLTSLAIVVFTGVGIYIYRWNDKFTRFVVNAVPYPAALVNGKIIRYSDYKSNVESMIHFLNYQKRKSQDVPLEGEKIEKDVLETLIKNEIGYQLAAGYGIEISREEIQKMTNWIISSEYGDSFTSINLDLKLMFDWNLSDYQEKVIKPMILFEKLQEAVAKDENHNAGAIKKLEATLKRISNNDNFEEIVLEYSEEENVENTRGKMLWWKSGDEGRKFEDIVKDIEVGEISQPFITNDGYNIVKLIDKKTDTEGREWYLTQRIIIKTKDLMGDVLNQKIGEAKIRKFIR